MQCVQWYRIMQLWFAISWRELHNRSPSSSSTYCYNYSHTFITMSVTVLSTGYCVCQYGSVCCWTVCFRTNHMWTVVLLESVGESVIINYSETQFRAKHAFLNSRSQKLCHLNFTVRPGIEFLSVTFKFWVQVLQRYSHFEKEMRQNLKKTNKQTKKTAF
jgi:hypothetical protein